MGATTQWVDLMAIAGAVVTAMMANSKIFRTNTRHRPNMSAKGSNMFSLLALERERESYLC